MQVNMSVAVIPMAEELGWSATDRGIVNSAFFWGYSITQIPAGWISTKCAAAVLLGKRARGYLLLYLEPMCFVFLPHRLSTSCEQHSTTQRIRTAGWEERGCCPPESGCGPWAR